jgi:steroid delta-isomerase-like uncharacterized protein
MDETTKVIEAYYAAFNAGDKAAFLALLTEDVAHDINQGERQVGREAFGHFVDHMTRCYRERLEDIVIMAGATPGRGAAEFMVHGAYIASDDGLPEATGQTYVLPAGAFFTLRDGKVARISNYYNLQDWIAQVGG